MAWKYIVGIDLGGTKCAVILWRMGPFAAEIAERRAFPTETEKGVDHTLNRLRDIIDELLAAYVLSPEDIKRIGISCGGPLDSKRGVIQSPPNLIGWDDIPITRILGDMYKVEARLQNDANACALAEWKYGAAQGCENVIFLTFGTGMGAGLILDGKLYSGTNDMAGEVGHMRLEEYGPVGFGKAGSFEGFCSGGGIADLARSVARQRLQVGRPPSWCPNVEALAGVNVKMLAEAAYKNDPAALEVFKISSRQLGRGLSILIDILNPEIIVMGSIFARCGDLFLDGMKSVIEAEALNKNRAVCRIVPAQLGEALGDYATLAVAEM
ncbi:MAG: ROK family protein [Clostridiales bacterium]|jgi:glucokinase|nr:ROK family protein [Clostridiales bacterium]